jgi:purine-nucleoside phosphorylase
MSHSPIRARAAASREFAAAERAARFIRARTRLRPQVALVLGSGLDAFAEGLTDAVPIPYSKIPHFPNSTAEGHAGRLVIGMDSDIPVAVMQGRVHFYEGYSLKEVTFPIRVLARVGIRGLILTNAAGGINLDYGQGALVLLRDHINLQGSSPLVGPNDERFGPLFPDMSSAYHEPYRRIAREAAQHMNLALFEGIYAALTGPGYETPAEIRYLRTIGADLVGMSTAPETIVARHMGLRVLGISCVTNMAARILDGPIHHPEVLETGERVKDQFIALLRAVLPGIARDIAADTSATSSGDAPRRESSRTHPRLSSGAKM